MANYYDILHVATDATGPEILQAYRDAVRACHPDLHPDDREAVRQFHQVQAAFEVLGDPDRRAAYQPAAGDAERIWSATRAPTNAAKYQPARSADIVFQRSAWHAQEKRACPAAIDEEAAIAALKIGTLVTAVLGYLTVCVFLLADM